MDLNFVAGAAYEGACLAINSGNVQVGYSWSVVPTEGKSYTSEVGLELQMNRGPELSIAPSVGLLPGKYIVTVKLYSFSNVLVSARSKLVALTFS
jgi:hypothetical protein